MCENGRQHAHVHRYRTLVRVSCSDMSCLGVAYQYVCLHLVPLLYHRGGCPARVHALDMSPLAVVLWCSDFDDILFMFTNSSCDAMGWVQETSVPLVYMRHARRRRYESVDEFLLDAELHIGDEANWDSVVDDHCSHSSLNVCDPGLAPLDAQRLPHCTCLQHCAQSALADLYVLLCTVRFHALALTRDTNFCLYLSAYAALCVIVNAVIVLSRGRQSAPDFADTRHPQLM